jgi:GcrA cell cycle regulator
MVWTDELRAQVSELWATGLSTAKIAEAMGINKNMVIGAAHRLDLEPRASPIKRNVATAPKPRPVPRARRATLPPLGGVVKTPRPVHLAVVAPTVLPVVSVLVEPAPEKPMSCIFPPPVAIADNIPKARPLTLAECCFPIGNPKHPRFRFCGGVAERGRPYCADHYRIAYTTWRRSGHAAAD